jgi:predicted metal-dependent peptidase
VSGEKHTAENVAMDRARQALRLASASLPHISGLARLVRLKPTRRVSVAAVAPSGLVLIQPDVFARIPVGEAAFVLAHELMHLALDTHGRAGDANRLTVNFAHDYIINDILRE